MDHSDNEDVFIREKIGAVVFTCYRAQGLRRTRWLTSVTNLDHSVLVDLQHGSTFQLNFRRVVSPLFDTCMDGIACLSRMEQSLIMLID